MRRYAKKVALLVVSIFMLTSIFVGCENKNTDTVEKVAEDSQSNENEQSVDKLEDVTLKMYLLGDKAKDFDLVYDEINKMLKQDINAAVEVDFMGWGDFQQKYPLVFASGEDFDVIYSANWAFYNSQATKGGFLEITNDMLEQYAPKTAETIYEDAWEQAKVNGKVYMLPMNYKELTNYVYVVRGDLMKKYGISEINSVEDFEEYLAAIAENEKQFIPLDIGSEFDCAFAFERLLVTPNDFGNIGNPFLYIDRNDENYEVFDITQRPEFLESVQKLKEWKDKGYWSKSAIVNKMTSKDSFLNGKSACAILNLNDAQGHYNSLSEAHPEWDVKVFDAQHGKAINITPFTGNGMSIHAQSKNPERALMFLDLLRNDERYADLVAYGIVGKHYELTSDNKIKPLPDTGNYPIDGNCNWGLRNDKFWKVVEGGMPNYTEIRDSWEKIAKPNPLATFNFDDSNVKNETATLYNIYKTDFKALMLGFTENPEEDVKRIQNIIKTAGIDKVKAEVQAQIDETYKK